MINSETLKVELEKSSYNILIGNGLIANAGEYLTKILPAKKVFIVTDDNVAGLYLHKLQTSLTKSSILHSSYVIKNGEQSKSFRGLENLLNKILEQKPDRKTTLIALGGGVVGDLTGFAASIILRGINFVQIPTTLLAQVDSSVGGKTGINTTAGKNLVGSFYQPSLVLADIDTIKYLPTREFLAGYAEVVKYGIINDLDFFNWLDKNLSAILEKDSSALQYIIKTSCASKAQIVVADERERGVRALLNLGHTFGHALETLTGYSNELLHGEAVAIGIAFALKLSYRMGLCEMDEVDKVINHLKKSGLKTSPLDIKPNWDANSLIALMRQDKKAFDGKMTFILANKVGSCFIENNVPENIVHSLVTDVITVQ
jgi:3-dehydroquinate synthase